MIEAAVKIKCGFCEQDFARRYSLLCFVCSTVIFAGAYLLSSFWEESVLLP